MSEKDFKLLWRCNFTFLPCLSILGGSEKLLRVCLNLPYFLRYINRFQDAVSANSFFIMPATVADATAVRNGYIFFIIICLLDSNALMANFIFFQQTILSV